MKPTPHVSAKRALLPSHSCPLHISILPMTALFEDQREYQYFVYFRDEISHHLSGHVPAKCWNYVVLQACNDNPTLRHLTVAVAALNKSKYSLGRSDTHHEFAVKRYGQALRGIQEIVASRDDTEAVRTTLIASLLIFCFESMHGNQESAIAHAKASLILMRKRLATSTRRYSQLRRISSIPGLEDEVLEVFVRLDNTIMSRLNNPRHPRASILDINYVDEGIYMPHEFRDVIEAKCYLEHFQYQAMTYLSHLTDVFMYGDQFACPVPDGAYELLTSSLRQWYSSFRPLFERAMRPGDKDFISVATLRALALSTDISVQRVCLKTKDRPPELFEAEARELIDLTRRIVQDHRFKKTFGFDCGVVPSLFIAIMICRNKSIREEAIQILRMAEGRIEVVWDASVIAGLGEKMLRAEEEGRTVLAF
jgi:hypothetical protein